MTLRRVVAGIRWRLRALPAPVCRRELLFFEKLAAPHSCPKSDNFERVLPGRGAQLVFPRDGWLPPDQLLRWLAAGRRRLLVQLDGSRVVAQCCIEEETADLSFLDLLVPIPPGTVYLSKLLVLPELRGCGVGSALFTAATAEAADSGALRVLVACVPGNQAVRSIVAAQGWAPLGSVAMTRIASFRRYAFTWNGRSAARRACNGRRSATAALCSRVSERVAL